MLHTLRVPPRGGESDGSAPCFGMSAGASRWPWPSSRTTPHEDRGRPGRGRRWRTRRTTAYGHRRLHLRGSGPVVSLTRGRSGVTAPCGTPRGKLLYCCRRRWPMRRPMLWTTPRSKSKKKKRKRRKLPKAPLPRSGACCATTELWSDSAENRAGAAVAVHRRSFASLRAAEVNPHGPACSIPYRLRSCSRSGGRCPGCARQVPRVLSARRQSRSHCCSSLKALWF